MKQRDLIAVSGKLYEYFRYDEEFKTHIVTEIEIDAEGNLAPTYEPTALTDSQISNRGIHLTSKQWIGLTKHFLREEFNFPEEEIDEIAKNIVDSFAVTRTPLVEELPNYIAIYIDK